MSRNHDTRDAIVALAIVAVANSKGEGIDIGGKPVLAWVRTRLDIKSILFHFIHTEAYSQSTDKVIETRKV